MQRRRRLTDSGRRAEGRSGLSLELEGAHRPPQRNAEEVARYIAQIAAEMMRLASAAQLDLLAYLLAMAQTEADATARASAHSQRD